MIVNGSKVVKFDRVIATLENGDRVNISGGQIGLIYKGQPITYDDLTLVVTPIIKKVERNRKGKKGKKAAEAA